MIENASTRERVIRECHSDNEKYCALIGIIDSIQPLNMILDHIHPLAFQKFPSDRNIQVPPVRKNV